MQRKQVEMDVMTLPELRKAFGNGRFATVTFTKKTTGEIRVLNGKTYVKRGVKGTGEFNEVANNMLRVFDVNLKDANGVRVGGYRSVTVDNVLDVRFNKKLVVIKRPKTLINFITNVVVYTNGDVKVEMFGGIRVYTYHNVNSVVAFKFNKAGNKGAFFNQFIKGKYNFTQVR